MVNGDFHGQNRAVVERTDHQIRVHDLEVSAAVDHAGGDFARALTAQAELLGAIGVQLQRQRLDVQDDIGDVLTDTSDRRKLVQDTVDLDRRHGGTAKR